jgi:hypothetical protein
LLLQIGDDGDLPHKVERHFFLRSTFNGDRFFFWYEATRALGQKKPREKLLASGGASL